jgi:hypothetical protein
LICFCSGVADGVRVSLGDTVIAAVCVGSAKCGTGDAQPTSTLTPHITATRAAVMRGANARGMKSPVRSVLADGSPEGPDSRVRV